MNSLFVLTLGFGLTLIIIGVIYLVYLRNVQINNRPLPY